MSAPGSVEAYLRRLRRRAAWLHGFRAGAAAFGVAVLTFAVGALWMGPLGSPSSAVLVWVAVALVAVLATVRGLGALRRWAGPGAAELLGSASAVLPSRVKSAVELGRDPGPASPEMVAAHRAAVAEALGDLPPSRIVPWSSLRHRTVALGLAAAAAGGLLLLTERAGAGAYALTHPGAREPDGTPLAAVFHEVRVHLVYPTYLGREPDDVADPTLLEVPLGTTLEVRATMRVAADEAQLLFGERAVPMELDGDRVAVGRVVVREDGGLGLRLREGQGAWVQDATERQVRALADSPPNVAVTDPATDRVLDQPEIVPIEWTASDDVGLRSVELVLRTPSGEERRRRLETFEAAASAPLRRVGRTEVDLRAFALEPGDEVRLRVEAKDGDVVHGPNVGRSQDVTLTLASEATRREARLGELEAVIDRSIGALADRLESPVPEEPDAATARFALVRRSTAAFTEALREYVAERRSDGSARLADLSVYERMAAEVRSQLGREAGGHRGTPAALPRRQELDRRLVETLEEDTLALDDLLTRARVEDAAAIARELEQLRQEMRSLLAELTRTEDPEARRALLSAIGRAQARLRDLQERIGAMGTDVPQEFMNAGGLDPGESADTLDDLREAVERGDLDQADRLVADLERQIDRLARALGGTEEAFVQSRFGPREQALGEAMDALAGLEAEQHRLARRADERRGRAAQRAMEELGGADGRRAEALAEQAETVRDSLGSIDRERLAGFEQDAYDRARERLRDTQDALRTGDLGEARRMAQAAAQDLGSLRRDLDLSALMFPGANGERGEDATRARGAERGLRRLRQDLDEALPDLDRHVSGGDRAQLQGDLPAQQRARGATAELAEDFDDGPDGQPLMPEAARELEGIAEGMAEAAEALRQGRAVESSRRQDEAAQRLTELRERLEQDQQQQRGQGGEGGMTPPDFRQPVEIPGADSFESPMEIRRRLLDGMRRAAPAGFEDAVRRYYEALLR